MATQLFFRGQQQIIGGVGTRGTNDPNLRGTTTWSWACSPLSTVRGSGVQNTSMAPVAGPTPGVEPQAYQCWQEWITPPLAADATISGTITFNLRAAETDMNTNAAINCVIDRVGPTGAIISEVCRTARTTELTLTTETAVNFTAVPTSTTFQKGDRIRARVFIDDATSLMQVAGAGMFWFSGTTAAASGDSYLTFTENLTFMTTDPSGSQLFFTDSASSIADQGAGVNEKEIWTSRGSGVTTASVTKPAGPHAPLQWTVSPGGNTVEWFTPQLQAFTLSGLVKATVRFSLGVTYGQPMCSCNLEIAVVNGDGSGAVVWASGCQNDYGSSATAESVSTLYLSGDDLAVASGQRLRVRARVDDGTQFYTGTPTSPFWYAGTSAAASGDAWVQLEQTVTQYVPTTPISGTDSGSGTEIGDTPLRILPDTGTSSEIISARTSVSEQAAASSDASALLAKPIGTDNNGASTESGIVTVPVTGTDTGAGSDTAVAPTVSDSKADTGAGSDITSLSRASSDSGAGSDASVISAQLAGTDSGTSSESGSQTVSSTDLGKWLLNENPAIHGTTIVDSSVAGNNGTLSTGDGSTNKSVTGKISGGITFDGTNDRVTLNTSIFNSIGAGDFTMLAWIYNTNPNKPCVILSKDDDVALGRQFNFCMNANSSDGANSPGKIFGYVFDAAGQHAGQEAAAGTVSANAWHHVVYRRQSGVQTLWLDGAVITTSAVGPGAQNMTVITNGAGLAEIGSRDYQTGGYEDFFQGVIDHVALYSRALSDTEIADEFAAGGVSKSGSDTGTGADTSVITYTYIQAESGAGTETPRISLSVSDTGAGTETGAYASPLSGTDSGTAIEITILTAPRTQSDTGAGSETGVLAAVIPPVSDTGAGVDASALVAKYTQSDIGAGSDASILAAPYTQSDTGAGTEASISVAAYSLSDSGAVAESGSTNTPISSSDTGIGLDAAAVRIALADTGTGSEISIISLTLSDTGTDVEASAIQIVVSDIGTGVDVISTLTRQVAETGSSSDGNILSAGNAKTGTDSGTGSDASALTAAFTQSDTGTDAEAFAIRVAVSDTGTSSETAAPTRTVIVADSGAGSDSGIIGAGNSLAVSDGGFSTDASILSVPPITVSDTGAGVDASTIQRVYLGADAGTGTEAITTKRMVSDFGGATDEGSFTSVNSLLVSQTGTGSDTANVSIRFFLSDTDFGIGIENSTLNISTAEPEYHHSVLVQATGYTSQTISTSQRKPQMVTANGGRSKMSKAQ